MDLKKISSWLGTAGTSLSSIVSSVSDIVDGPVDTPEVRQQVVAQQTSQQSFNKNLMIAGGVGFGAILLIVLLR